MPNGLNISDFKLEKSLKFVVLLFWSVKSRSGNHLNLEVETLRAPKWNDVGLIIHKMFIVKFTWPGMINHVIIQIIMRRRKAPILLYLPSEDPCVASTFFTGRNVETVSLSP